MGQFDPASPAEVEIVVSPEGSETIVQIGKRRVAVKPLVRRWQKIFDAAALPLIVADTSGPEAVIKAIATGEWMYGNMMQKITDSAILADEKLDKVAAIILASQVEDAHKNVNAVVQQQLDWLQENARSEELIALVDAQMDMEKLLIRVGERLPTRYVSLLSLVGMNLTKDSLTQLLTNLQQILREISSGDGVSHMRKLFGLSSDGSAATTSPKTESVSEEVAYANSLNSQEALEKAAV